MEDSDRTLGSERTIGGDARTFGSDARTILPDDDLAGEQAPTLPPGTMLAGRYQIVDLLGVGGMGAVYRAFDTQLTRLVALKTILPEMAATPTALKRFKQEVLLAQSIVHKNVVRIFDIGEDGGTKFITMDFIEGVDLKHVISSRGKLPALEAAGIMRQVCSGLEAAHGAGVVHRDLKPQNIMMEKDGHIIVMDFGIAGSGQTRGTTQTGAFLGTPDYMSPEQAQTEQMDARSDIYSLGLILYELLTGKLPFHGKTVLETMFKRTTEQAAPPVEIEPGLPKGINDIVVKCLQKEREKRYQSVTELLADLETFDPTKKVGAADRAKARLKKAGRYRNIGIAAALILIALVAGFTLRNRFAPSQPAVAHAPVTILLADFTNHTGEPVFDGALEPVVKLALEGATFINVYDRTRVRTDLGLPPISGRLDESAARKIATGQGLGVVIAGSLDRQDNGYSVSMKATEAVTGNTIQTTEGTASNKDQVLFTATKLASTLRKALGDDTSDSAQRFAMESLSATSLEAIHEYAAAMDAVSNAKYEEALSSFSKAIDLDSNFGLAYAGMAVASRALGQQQDAVKNIDLALKRIDRMTERERYRTRGFYYALGGGQKCVEEYTTLINRFPSDAAAHNNLAFCLSDLRNMPKALEHVRQAATILPKRLTYRLNISLFASYGSDFQTGEKEARAAQELDASSRFGFIALAFGQMGQGQTAQAAETYQKLVPLSKLAASDSKAGLADIAIYEGRFRDAVRILEQGAEEDLASKYPDRAAERFATLAYVRLVQGQKGPAAAAAERALTASKIVKIQFLTGRILATTGQTARAKALATDLSAETQAEPQAYAKLIEAEIARAAGDPRQAVKMISEANNILDTWIGHLDLGRAYLEAGLFIEADSEFDRVIKRRGEALSLFLDQSPTYGYFPIVHYYVGRVREGLKSAGFADSYRTYLSIRQKAGEDPLLAELSTKVGK